MTFCYTVLVTIYIFFLQKRQEMIGIKVQNLIWEKALLGLLGVEAEKYQDNHLYDILISQEKKSNPCTTLILGKDIPIPFSFEVLKDKIAQAKNPQFENDFFKWLPQTRQLLQKKNKKIIQLTEKESEIIGFLAQCPQHKATKEKILQAVWHYQTDIHTHTLESHVYSLRQKIAPNTDHLIIAQDGIYTLI